MRTVEQGKAFTLIEVVIVMVMVGLLALAVLPRFSQDSRVGGDIIARSSLEAAVGAVATFFEQTHEFPRSTSVDDMARLQDIAGRISISTDASSGPRDVSILVTGDVAVVSAANEGTCYWIRRDFFAESDPSVYAISTVDNTGGCAAADGQSIGRENGRGGSWAEPVEVSSE